MRGGLPYQQQDLISAVPAIPVTAKERAHWTETGKKLRSKCCDLGH
jgi:hypothetical protein